MQEVNNKKTSKLNQKWIKAAVLGSVWAASEIILGSFLHNIKMPFSGNVLVGIAMILLISASHLWKENGVIWRSGLICALLKSLSPSAIIFTPMIAIFTQGVLLDSMVRVFKHKKAGYFIGAALAMSWNLVQKIIMMIFFYGMNLIKVYEKIIQSAQRKLHMEFDVFWAPISLLLSIYVLLGLLAAYFGIKIGKQLLDKNYHPQFLEVASSSFKLKQPTTSNFKYSIFWLIANIILPITIMILKNYISFYLWIALVVVLVFFWAIKYKRAFRQVVKPKFWISFILITMLTSILFSNFQDSVNGIQAGVMIGVTMNVRAILLIVSLTVLGTELYNPKIRNWLQKGRFRNLSLAMQLSLESLPSVMANMPSFKTILKSPSIVFYQLIWQANERLNENIK